MSIRKKCIIGFFILLLIFIFGAGKELASGLMGDVNEDGSVDIIDIGIVLDNYGVFPITYLKADINIDGSVDIIDIGIIIDHYGETSTGNMTYEVSYTTTGFTPNSITINSGDTVVFKNNKTRDMWPASDQHPTHLIYPEFDALHNILPGNSWSFTFTRIGTWGYHDHLSPGSIGTVVVQ